MNPHGGGGRAAHVLSQVDAHLRSQGVELQVHETEAPGHARELAGQLELHEGMALCALGGDGTIHEVVNGLMDRRAAAGLDAWQPPLAVLPGGSGNALMHDLAALDPREAARRILSGRRRSLDLVRVEMGQQIVHAFNIIGWGLVSDIGARSEKLRWMGSSRYTVASVLEVLKQPARRGRVVLQDEVLEGSLRFVFAGNTRHTGAGMRITPDARIDDGLLDLIVVRGGTRAALLGLFAKLRTAEHLSSPLVIARRVSQFRLEAEGASSLNIDGELVGQAPFDARVVPAAIKLLV